MKNYELTIVLPGKASANKKSKAKKFIEDLVRVSEGKINKTEEWGTIDFAYKIKSNEKGLFMYFEFEMSPEYGKQLDDKLRIEEDIVRYLLIKSEK